MAEPAGFDMDEQRMFALQRGEIDGRTIRRVDIAAIDQNVAAGDQFGETCSGSPAVRIEHDTRLVEIEKREPRALPLRRQRRGAAKRIALRRFDLLNRCAEIGKQPRTITTRRRTS